jgi:hypothetical protein
MLLVLFFFVVAMGFSIYCWVKKQGLLGLLSFALWFLFVVQSFGLALAQWDLYYDFGLFGSLMAFIMIITSLYNIIKGRASLPGEEEPEEVDYVTRISEHRKRIAEAVRKRRGEY